MSDRYLVLAPHPDDETLGAGGLIAKAVAVGCDVSVVILTDGARLYRRSSEKGLPDETLVEGRRQQCRAAIEALGARQPRFLSGRDRQLASMRTKIAADVASEIDAFAPTHILIPHPSDRHRDHRACQKLLQMSLSSVRRHGPVAILGYEIWLPCQASHCLDISDVVARKIEALNCYRETFRGADLGGMILGLNRFRAASELMRDGWGEAFQLLTR